MTLGWGGVCGVDLMSHRTLFFVGMIQRTTIRLCSLERSKLTCLTLSPLFYGLGSSIASSSLERGTALNEELLELKRRVLSYQQARRCTIHADTEWP